MPELPLKMAILKAIIDSGPLSEASIIKHLESVYGRERQFTPRAVGHHILALQAVGIITDVFHGAPGEEPAIRFIASQTAKEKMEKFVGR